MIEVGEQAPDFSLPVARGAHLRLGELLAAGTTAVLVFYPLDFSPK
jgi:peroxiredoxin